MMIADELETLIESAYPRLTALTPPATTPSGSWSHHQVIGHLIDSAANNHRCNLQCRQHARHEQRQRQPRTVPPRSETAGQGILIPKSSQSAVGPRSEEHTSELQSLRHLVC